MPSHSNHQNRRDRLIGAVKETLWSRRTGAGAPPRPRRPFDVTHTVLHTPSVDPAHEGLLIAQLSDLHVGWHTPDERIREAIATINQARPDVVLLTGDFVTWSRRPLLDMAGVLQGLQAPVFACLGNHDHRVDARAVRRILEDLGYTVLQNTNTTMRIKGAPLTVVGVDDGTTRHDDVTAAFRGARSRGTQLVITHTPSTATKLPPNAGLVCFSGHTHGGAVMLGNVTPAVFRLCGEPFVRGLYQVGGNQLYVNRGLGFGTPLSPRIRSEPEVSLFTLRGTI